MSISVIVPNYNGEKLLKTNLPSVIASLKNYQDQKEIIIVDDASEDSSKNIIKKFIDNKDVDIQLLENEKNLGFASTVNKGVENAKGEIVVLLNTDVKPQENFLIPLISNFSDGNVFAVGALDKSIENQKVVKRGRGLGKWRRGFLVHRRGEVNKKDTLWVSGGSGAFRKAIWEVLGGLNELYNPFYYEDIDLSYRALKSGYKIIFEPKSIVVHNHEEGSIKSKYSDSEIKTIAYRNQFIFVWENATDLDLQFSHLLWLPGHLVKALLRRDKEFFVGFLGALILFPKVIKFKLKAQKLFIKKDKEIIRELDE